MCLPFLSLSPLLFLLCNKLEVLFYGVNPYGIAILGEVQSIDGELLS